MKQESKQLTIDEQIELLWQSNGKIPFMQSKDILAFGYRQGIESIKSTDKVIQNKPQNNEFTGNSKELIDYADKEIKKRQVNESKNNKRANDILVNETKFQMMQDLLEYINENQDLIAVYQKIKNMKRDADNNLKKLYSMT